MNRSARDVVRDGYDAVCWAYRGDDESPSHYRAWIDLVLARLPPRGARVLDLGCGCGVPTTRELAAAGHEVIGVDISPVQIGRASRLVPTATFLEQDITTVSFDVDSFDLVVSLYTLIHLPDVDQRQMVEKISDWLRSAGTFLATVGVHAAEGADPDWLGTAHAMWWNHPEVATFRQWLGDAGLAIDHEEFVAEGSAGHQLIVAHASRSRTTAPSDPAEPSPP